MSLSARCTPETGIMVGMPEQPRVERFEDLVDRASRLVPARGRALLGVAGAPGAGKTTLALALVRALTATGLPVVHVPMDGFHLADVELARLGRRDRKGAPDTFDAAGYAALLQRLRGAPAREPGPVYAPAFDREIEQPVAGSVPVPAECRLVVSEGNYLLVDTPPWRAVRAAFDEIWFHETDQALRRERLVARHVRFGKSPEHARAWVERTDEPNARLVETSRGRADLVVTCADLPA
ncbi:phosphoribulokinase/uridine kinase family protein [Pseudonocardia autotrophica]|uniref:Nucleoside triphosphate hydrolase domain-containing protein n=3 Tax=Pseudonocardia TaxID=1847 RepID=A0A1Y2MX86_PSEAH|nr:nucleoside triphosphate hydrolase domain-containing protein [Pseudonocardia autotrophica]TDN74391.1 phosphoribulokinase/uridine kinase family protein [Pseudonocardia autotrophica]BBG05158.1 nucleoside/nucleotide kinase family protein [Pseudonocardia autotrophica]